MARQTRIHWGGISLMMAAFFSFFQLIFGRLDSFELRWNGASSIFGGAWFLVVIFSFAVGAVGIHALLGAERGGWRLGGLTAIGLGLLVFIGGTFMGILSTAVPVTSCGYHCITVSTPSNLGHLYASLRALGALSIGIGVLIWGVLMQQQRPLAWWGNLMPFVLDALFMEFVFKHTFSATTYALASLAWVAATFALGRALWQVRQGKGVVSETPPAVDMGS